VCQGHRGITCHRYRSLCGACSGKDFWRSREILFQFPCIIRLYYIKDQQDAPLVICLLVTARLLYMFRTFSASIIRSTKNCISNHWCVSCCNYKATYKQVLCVIQAVIEYNRTVLGCIELKANIKYICSG
jgi:hypothetical protein